jgi:hypothetical protein
MPTIAYPEKYKLGSVLCPLRKGVRSVLSHQFHRMRRTWDFYQRESGLPSYSPRGDFNFEVLPNLPIGAFVHFHDVFWPFEYPAKWIAEGQSWNEAYLLRAFLAFNDSFQIVFWVPFAALRWSDTIKERMPAYLISTGEAIWIRRTR